MKMTAKQPGLVGGLRHTELDLSYKTRCDFACVSLCISLCVCFRFGAEAKDLPDAYERLILDVVRGDHNLFVRGDEVTCVCNRVCQSTMVCLMCVSWWPHGASSRRFCTSSSSTRSNRSCTTSAREGLLGVVSIALSLSPSHSLRLYAARTHSHEDTATCRRSATSGSLYVSTCA